MPSPVRRLLGAARAVGDVGRLLRQVEAAPIVAAGVDLEGDPWIRLEDGLELFGYRPRGILAALYRRLGSRTRAALPKDCLQVALEATYNEQPGGKVREYMNHSVSTVHTDTSIVEVAKMFLNGRYRRYPVLDENRLVGQISRRDVLKALESLW